jgi:chromosome segregation and condensation protein ScpB
VLDDRLAQVGLKLVDDGVTVSVAPLAFAHTAADAVSHVESIPKLTERQLTILCFVAFADATTLRRIERMCDSDCESLLARMVDHGLLACTRDRTIERAPNFYRLSGRLVVSRFPLLS